MRRILGQTWAFAVVFVCSSHLYLSSTAQAYTQENRWNRVSPVSVTASAKEIKITDSQLRVFCNTLVSSLMKKSFFKSGELPDYTVMAKLEYEGDKPGRAIKITDMLLNKILDYSRLIIVNQDLTTHLNVHMSFKLMSYDTQDVARHKGMLMGADYIISGKISESIVTPKGAPQRELKLDVTLSNIRTGEVVAQEQTIKYFK